MTDHTLRLHDRNAGAVAQQINRLYGEAPIQVRVGTSSYRVTSIVGTAPACAHGPGRVGVLVRTPGRPLREVLFDADCTIVLVELPVSAPVPIPSPRSQS